MFARKLEEIQDLHGKVAVVTGGARGIGQAIAGRLAQAGASVMVVDLREADALETVRTITESGGRAGCTTVDVSRIDQIQKAVSQTVEQFGDIDILVNNAAVFPLADALSITEQQWDLVLDVNLKSTFFFAQAVARVMKSKGHGGAIINLTSLGYLIPPGLLSHYDASKGGVVSLTRSLAKEFGPLGIRVNAIAPGHMKTPGADESSANLATSMNMEGGVLPIRAALGRYGTPDDVAKVAYFLATDLAGYVTGSVMEVGGGYQVY